MKKLAMALSLLVTFSAHANDWGSFLQTPLGNYVKAGIALGSSLEHRTNTVSIAKGKSLENCRESFKKAQANWKKTDGKINAAYLTHNISNYHIKSQPIDLENLKWDVHSKGLSSEKALHANSWNPTYAPHMDSSCSKHWKVKESFIADNGEDRCRIVKVALEELTYNINYCVDSNHIEIDPTGTKLVENRIPDDCNCD